MGSMAMTPEEIEQKMDELARKYVETHNDPSKGWGRKKSHKTPR
jgi:ABC-type proline/glycine betaine transport system substrate-binding protein